MLSCNLVASLVAATTVVLVPTAHAHVYLTHPLAEFPKGVSKSSWVAQFPPPWEGDFKTGAKYAAAAKAKDKGAVCGNSLKDATPKTIPVSGKISLASTIEHAGPCEVWFDDVLAFHDDDCEKTFGSATSFVVDFSKCSGSCLLRFYWLGLQDGGKRWQSYKNCVPLKGDSGASASGSNSTKPSAPSNATPKPNKTPKPTKTTKTPTIKSPKTDEPAGEASVNPVKCNRRLED